MKHAIYIVEHEFSKTYTHLKNTINAHIEQIVFVCWIFVCNNHKNQ